MPKVLVTVKPEIIDWVLQEIQYENIADTDLELLHMWKSGEKEPTFNQVEAISRKTNIPFGYFFLNTPPVETNPIVEFRTYDSDIIQQPSRNLIDTLDSMYDMQDWMISYLQDNGVEPLTYVNSISINMPVLEIAQIMRKRLSLEEDWFSSSRRAIDSFNIIRQRLEAIGVLVFMNGTALNNTHRPLSVKEFRAFTLVDPYAPLIFINTKDTDTGKLFSIVHEAVHIWLGVDSLYNDPTSNEVGHSNIERICNAVAAEILAPRLLFLNKWNEESGAPFERISRISRFFTCSRYVIARRALDTKRISKKTYDAVVSQLADELQRFREDQALTKKAGGNYYNTLQSRLSFPFVNALANSTSEGKTMYTDAYRLTRTNRKTFAKLLEKMGGV